LDWEKISVFGDILLKMSVMTHLKCPPVKPDWLFGLLLSKREKCKLFARVSVAEYL
jgi:hypothetical protein